MRIQAKKYLPALLVCAVILLTAVIGIAYFNFISQRIFADSTGHLEELYSQVNRSFQGYLNRKWQLLEDWETYLELAETEDRTDTVLDYLNQEQRRWGYSSLYFLSRDGSTVLPDGSDVGLSLDEASWQQLEGGENVMVGGMLPSGLEVTLFAVYTPGRTLGDLSYDAIAVAYNNEDMASSLNVDAYDGQTLCFVIHDNGDVLLSTQAGGSVFRNYLTYLKAAAHLDDAAAEQLRRDWESGTDGLFQCEIGGVDHCILYQTVGYQDYLLLSVVPLHVISAGFQSVQSSTMRVLVLMFLLLGVTAITLLLVRSRRMRRQSQIELQYREQMFDTLSNSVDDFFIMLNSQTLQVEYISPNVERLVGIPLQEARENIRVLEQCAINSTVAVPRDELEAIPLNGSRQWECEYRHQGTGERRWYRMIIYRKSIQDVVKYIIVMSDRTEEQKMNQNLSDALAAARSANEAKSNFLSNMSHDIRTPMNAIVGFSVLLEKEAENPEKVREYTHKITASSQHLLSLINDVLDMSKIESNKTSLNVDCFSLPQMLEELSIILMPQAKAKHQTFDIHVQGNPPERLMGDKLRLNQILINLLSNAIKYTQDGGSILFSLTALPQLAPSFAAIRFQVQDNGMGMSEEFQGTIFEPFSREENSTTNKIQGTGLGMAITKSLVDLMGGVISLESKLGEGSTFTVDLTFALPAQEDDTPWFLEKITRILAADDEEDSLVDIRETMAGTGIEVVCAGSGQKAVDLAAEAHRQGQDFSAILLDWKMPVIDGVEAARQIRAQVGGGVPIILFSSYDWPEIEHEARAAGVDSFLPKPFFLSSLWQALAPHFNHENPDAQAPADNEHALEGRYFLVAEDNELNAEILSEMLDMEGARCDITPNGKEALEQFLAAAPGTYDMILMDVQMPVMNGYEATEAIRASEHPEARTIPIVAMTANTFAEDVRRAMDAGMDGHLAKPIDMKAVRETVSNLLQQKHTTQQEGSH